MGVEIPIRGIAGEWLQLFAGSDDAPKQLARALGLAWPPAGSDAAALVAAGDLGLAAAAIVALEPAAVKSADDNPGLARQWRFAAADEKGIDAVILPVGMDEGRPYYAPGQVPLSIARCGMRLFVDCICDLVAIPLSGGRPLSMTGFTLAVGRFAVRERGELEIFAGGINWLKSHLDRARAIEAELPAHLIPSNIDLPDHFSTLILEPKAIEWRPQALSCAFPPATKTLMVMDSEGLANAIAGMMRQKPKLPPMPKVFGPKAGVA